MTYEKVEDPNISDLEIIRIYKTILMEWQDNLKDLGVRLPQKSKEKSKRENGALLQLLILRKYKGKYVSKEGLSEAVRDKNAKLKSDQQARHLGTQRGFNVLCGGEIDPNTKEKVPFGYYILINMTDTKPGFCLSKRDARTPTPKYKDGDCCANCGAIQGQQHPKKPTQITKIEAGHRDPAKPLLGDNIIPQCQYCNKTTKNHVVWGPGNYPLPIALGSPDLLMRSSLDVQKATYDLLHDKFQTDSER